MRSGVAAQRPSATRELKNWVYAVYCTAVCVNTKLCNKKKCESHPQVFFAKLVGRLLHAFAHYGTHFRSLIAVACAKAHKCTTQESKDKTLRHTHTAITVVSVHATVDVSQDEARRTRSHVPTQRLRGTAVAHQCVSAQASSQHI